MKWNRLDTSFFEGLPTTYISPCKHYMITEGILGDEDGWLLLPNTNDAKLISDDYYKLAVDNKHFSKNIEQLKYYVRKYHQIK